MTEEVIDGVLHRLEGKVFVPLTAAELTARLLEARQVIGWLMPPPPIQRRPEPWPLPWVPCRRTDDGIDYWYRQPTAADPIPGITITSGTTQ